MALKFCPKCGNELEPNAAFCEACGADLKERTEQAETSTPTPKIDPFRAWWFTMPFDFLVGFLYHWGLEAHNKGQTLGKMALNIRTVDEHTLQLASPSNYAVNNIFKGSGLIIIDLLIGLFKYSGDPKNRVRVMQSISETVVIMTR